MAEKQRPFTKRNGMQSHTSENACIIFPPLVVLTDVKDPTITLWRSVKRVMFNCLSSGSGRASVLRNGTDTTASSRRFQGEPPILHLFICSMIQTCCGSLAHLGLLAGMSLSAAASQAHPTHTQKQGT